MAAGEEVRLVIREGWMDYFGGRNETFHVSVNAPGSAGQRLGWALSAGGRVVARGETTVDETFVGAFAVTMPSVKEGVVIDGVLSVTALGSAGNRVLSSTEQAVYLFGENPFADRTAWLEKCRIQLFDPGQLTADVLEKLGVPFESVRNVGALADGDGLLLVGEGVSFEDYPGLADALVQAAISGQSVLCLAPADGSFAVPGASDPNAVRPVRLCFRGTQVIGELDKKLDGELWPVRGNPVARDFALTGERRLATVECAKAGAGWPWLEAEFPGGGCVIFCGFAVVESWETGPAPRFLLLRIFEHMESIKQKKEKGS